MPGSTKAHQRYRVDGKIVPGVTTILNLLNKPALVPWAWKLGMQGIDYRKTTQQAADVGTITHYLVECFLKKEKPELDNFTMRDIQQSQVAYGNFEEWWRTNGYRLIASEAQLSCRRFLYGGTIDIVAQNSKGTYDILDVKTSKGLYDEMLYQLAAYKYMWNENYFDKQISDAYVIRLDKVTGAVNFHALGNDLSTELEIFLRLRDVYELTGRKDVKRRNDPNYFVPYWYQLID